MTHLKLITLLILFSSQTVFSQLNSRVDISKRLKEADTVLFVSHTDVAGSTNEFVDSTSSIVSIQPLLVDRKLNENVIVKKVTLSKINLISLSKILSRPYKEKVISQAGCFTSHHSIIFIKKQKTSFIDLCFSCSQYETSADLKNIYAFDRLKWEQLEALFNGVGFAIDKEDYSE